MTEVTQDLSLAQAHSLIDSYDFDLGRDDAEQLLQSWLNKYHASWIRLATIEALYQGRYKAISITQILNVWERIGNPNTHFTYEFERLICRKLPKHLSDLSDLSTPKKTESDRDELHLKTQNTTIAEFCAKAVDEQAVGEQAVDEQAVDETDLTLTEAFQQPKPSHGIPLISALGFPYQTDWSEFTEGHTMIHQFIPLPDVSSFFNKLKTFGEEKLERQ